MKIVQTLVVRDEEEILRANLDYHLAAGVDLVLVIDHRSEDATPEILESYRATGAVRVFREEAQFVPQHEWQTRLARLAFTEHDADWVLLGDADEFWWPLGPSLPDVLALVPDTYGSVLGLQRNFVPLRAEGRSFAERMVVSLAASAPINDPATPFRPVAKVAVRGSADVLVRRGGHQVSGVRGEQLTAWHPLEILHFPLRSREQCARKYEKTWTGWESNLRGDLARAHLRAAGADRVDAMWERLALDDDAVERGIADHGLLVDTRLRDALGALGREGSGSAPYRGSRSLELLAQVFVEAEVVRRQRWLDDLTLRARRLEDRRWRGRGVPSR